MVIETSTVLYFAGRAAFDFVLSFCLFRWFQRRKRIKKDNETYKYIDHRVIKNVGGIDVDNAESVRRWKKYLDLLDTKIRHESLFVGNDTYDYQKQLNEATERVAWETTTILDVSKGKQKETWIVSNNKAINEKDFRYASKEEFEILKNVIKVAESINEDVKRLTS